MTIYFFQYQKKKKKKNQIFIFFKKKSTLTNPKTQTTVGEVGGVQASHLEGPEPHLEVVRPPPKVFAG